ncbi:MAG: FkbM family methyltransferase [Polaribacter sp.]|uniref:FkbM family methyltransferase n=1 Tax=Polaribacter sp. TaxID=1920175 RepID=UPI003BB0E564
MNHNLKLELHEKVITKLFDINSELIIFDIGACEGLSSVRYLSIFENAKGFAFEPLPNNYKQVLENKVKNKLDNLHAFELGLSSKKGEATFYVSSGKPPNKDKPTDNSTDFGNKSSSLYKPGKTKEVHPWLEFKESITIETETLENFCKSHKINSIDFIHMDVQGAELLVLEGASTFINNIKSLWLEVEKIELYEEQALKSDIEKFLTKHNFICILNKVNHIAGDQFWVQKSYFDSLNENVQKDLKNIKSKTELKSKASSFVGNLKMSLKKVIKS